MGHPAIDGFVGQLLHRCQLPSLQHLRTLWRTGTLSRTKFTSAELPWREPMLKMISLVSAYSMWGSIFLLPLLIVQRLRGFFGAVILFLTYAWGFTLWLTCCGYVLANFGVFLVVLGCLLGVIGVIPLAIIAAFVHHQAHEAWFLIGCVTLLLVIRALAITAQTSAAKMEEQRRREDRIEAMGAAENPELDDADG